MLLLLLFDLIKFFKRSRQTAYGLIVGQLPARGGISKGSLTLSDSSKREGCDFLFPVMDAVISTVLFTMRNFPVFRHFS